MIEKYTASGGGFGLSRRLGLYFDARDIASTAADQTALDAIEADLAKELTGLMAMDTATYRAAQSFMEQVKHSVRFDKRRFTGEAGDDDRLQTIQNESANFVMLVASTVRLVRRAYEELLNFSRVVRPPALSTFVDRTKMTSAEGMRDVLLEVQLNAPGLEEYMGALASAHLSSDSAGMLGSMLVKALEDYYKMLMHRHTAEGEEVHGDAVITDVAIRVYENIDSDGETERGKDGKHVSAYTLRKAEALSKGVKSKEIHQFIEDPELFLSFIKDSLRNVQGLTNRLRGAVEPQSRVMAAKFFLPRPPESSVEQLLSAVDDLNPKTIAYSAGTEMQTESERMVRKVRSETVGHLVRMLKDPDVQFDEMVRYVLSRKEELRRFFQDENSFYVCQIGGGNAFFGEAPGALSVVPAERPRADMSKILGSGFDEVRDFVAGIKATEKYHELFLSTSPSGTADKSNVLLIGPQGCGKTQVLRGMGSDKGSIGVFASGSDFLTCWKGEAEKNPKRMFEAGLKLSRDSGRHVHFLIDEIDSVLNSDRDHTGTNLTLEFQILMDGVVAYPNLSVWGTTNAPERIPMPMIRRFSKVVIVGELSKADRVELLKHYLGFMPLSKNIRAEHWGGWADSLDGATGDVIRKVADQLWRSRMATFVKKNPSDADAVIEAVKSLTFDNPRVVEIQLELRKVREDKERIVRSQRYEEAAGLRDRERTLTEELNRIAPNVADAKFSLDSLDRVKLVEALRPHVELDADAIDLTVESMLDNVGIAAEIKTAKAVYGKAKTLLSNVREHA